MTAISHRFAPEIEQVVEGLTQFLKHEVVSRHERHAALLDDARALYLPDGRYAPPAVELIREVRKAAAEAGYYQMAVPESLGGHELGHVAYFAAIERIAHFCAARYWLGYFSVAHWASGPSPVLRNLTAEAREKMLPGIMNGERSLCFGLSEPEAGSDAFMIQTRAEPDGHGWRLNGSKIWTTNAPIADYAIVFAVTDKARAEARNGGISAFIVPTNTPGFQITQIIRMWGSVGGNEGVLQFDDVFLEPHQLVGELHEGFRIAMRGVNLGRIFNTARAVGISRHAVEITLEHISLRKAFGRRLADFQGLTFPLADAATDIHAAHLMGINVAQLLDDGHPARKELSMTKSFAVRAATRAVDLAIQAHGAMGMTNELHLHESYFTVRQANIADGTNEILKRAIAKELLGGDVDL